MILLKRVSEQVYAENYVKKNDFPLHFDQII